ncbi:hypothetical protein BT67DRAFT_238543 [Trichocladium antarcticum]|uniref:Uncharacterized protein n=1 Tax=Trichocladium antarcticum TaxID=1450529 RepID=A0AAN6UP54_9PEZI|nr:hypothetical protein BT67DRAFT_238543 [Trichocladium antarcticum]
MTPPSAPPASRWPYHPFWELDGFDFGRLPLRHYFHAMRHALQKGDFTTVISGFSPTGSQAEQAEHSQRVCNNVAVQFRAMLYCKDTYPNQIFWKRVHFCTACGDRDGYGPDLAEQIGTIFTGARRAYLGNRRGHGQPNGAARLADDWIRFLDSPRSAGSALQTSFTVPWDIRYRDWVVLKSRDGLMDAGQPPVLNLDQRAATSAAGQQPARPQCDVMPTARPSHVEARREGIEDRNIPDDASNIDLGGARPDGFGQGASRGSKRKGVETYTSYSAKRRGDTSTGTAHASETRQDHRIQSPPPSSPLAQRRPIAPASSDRAAIRSDALFAAPRDDSLSSIVARLTICEDRLVEQRRMILNQDLRQSEFVSKNTTQVAGLGSRLRTVEENAPAAQQARGGEHRPDGPLADKVEAIRATLVDLDDCVKKSAVDTDTRFKSRNTYIRDEVRTQWKEFYPRITQEQTRAAARVDRLTGDLAVQKSCLEGCRKVVDEHTEKIQKHENGLEALEGSVEKKERRLKHKMDKLSARTEELEKMRSNEEENESGSGDDSRSDGEDDSQAKHHLIDLRSRVGELERKTAAQASAANKQKCQREASVGKLHTRLQVVESQLSGGNGNGPGRISLEPRTASQQDQLDRHELLLESLNKQMSALHKLIHPPAAGDKKGRRHKKKSN